MKIALFDSYAGKFTQDMEDWWVANGHEVRRDTNYNPELVVWADIVWFDCADNNLISASSPDQALKDEWKYANRPGAWDMHEMDMSKKKVICRPIDIDVWTGHHASIQWDVVNECIFIAPHIREIMMADSRPQASAMGIHTIPHSINLDKWTYKDREGGFNIAVVAEIWESKGVDYALQIALKLKKIDPRYHIFYLGREQDYQWHRQYRAEFVKNNDLPITFITEPVDSVDAFLEDKHYLLHCSTKEAFSAATAEAAAKGIKPVLHAFGGYEPLWGDSGWVWQGIDEAIAMITSSDYDSASYRGYLTAKEYTTPQMMNKIMEVIA